MRNRRTPGGGERRMLVGVAAPPQSATGGSGASVSVEGGDRTRRLSATTTLGALGVPVMAGM